MITAMRNNDASYDGKFYVGVTSTRIYCLPSCRAKLPKLENVVFYATREEAIAAGLRGCRRCKSERYPDILPVWLYQILKYMKEHHAERLTEDKLISLSPVDISTVRRYFKIHLGMTPLAFHRKIRLDHARQLLESGVNYLETAYECGYESTSGFREAFLRQYGCPPGRLYVKQ
jgi:AraC family transcriptional regulator of adaptative response/methylated-DNA-[protein]-cysteine methyltransferase